MVKLYTVSVENTDYKTSDPVIFKSLIAKGHSPLAAIALVDEIVKAMDMIMDGMCMALTFLPSHKIEYLHPCVDGSNMRMLIEKF